nr:spore germination protein [Peribacillus simplex]
MKQKTGSSPDIIIRTLKTSQNPENKVSILYVQGLIDNLSVTDFLIESIMKNPHLKEKLLPHEALEVISKDVVSLGGVEPVTDWGKLFLSLLSGDSVIFVDGINIALVRRIINSPDLWIESMKIGTVTKTDVSIM